MNKPASKDSNLSQTGSRSIVVAVAITLIAGSILGGFFLLQRRASTTTSGYSQYSHIEPEQAESNYKATLARATELRRKWQKCAEPHKQLLKAMLSSSGENQAAFLAVRTILPDLNELLKSSDIGVTREELGSHFVKTPQNTWAPNPDPNIVVLDWRILPRVPDEVISKQLHSESEKERFVRQQKQAAASEQDDFSKWHDIMIASGSNEGFNVYLWASGRVTERRWSVGRDLDDVKNRVFISNAQALETLPPYDFLK